MNAVASEKLNECGVDELSTIISLYRDNRKVELCVSIGDEVNECVASVGFAAKWKSPHVVRKIIDYNKVVFKTRITRNRRGP
jgi:hypothetical protein